MYVCSCPFCGQIESGVTVVDVVMPRSTQTEHGYKDLSTTTKYILRTGTNNIIALCGQCTTKHWIIISTFNTITRTLECTVHTGMCLSTVPRSTMATTLCLSHSVCVCMDNSREGKEEDASYKQDNSGSNVRDLSG